LAERIVKDGWDKPTLRVTALNEGRWGNAIWVRCAQATGAKTLLTLDLDVGAGEARVNSSRGFERGALVRIFDRQNSDYVVLTDGRDGIEEITAEDFIGYDHGPGARSGLMALGAVDTVSALGVPDAMLSYARNPGPQADLDVQRVQDAMISICENRKDVFAILDAPPTKDIETVRRLRRRLDTSYAAIYYPWLVVGGTGA